MRLEGKVAIITGAASGIGRASALMFADEGAKVVVSDINDALGQETVDTIKAKSGKAIYVHADVASEVDIQRLIKSAVDTFGKLDIVFNNAAYYVWPHGLADISGEEWDQTFAVNVKSIFWAAKFAVPEMKKNGGGSIINTASMAAVQPRANCAYGSSKAAVVGLTKSLAFQLAPHHIRVNAINPDSTETPLLKKFLAAGTDDQLEENKKQRMKVIPLGRLVRPEDVAYAAVFLASDESSMFTGSALNVDGGTAL
jgi:3-oxoacyl-[acyl-carrier protein] reductase